MALGRGRSERRGNALLTGVLLAVVAVFANLLARDHLGWRRDVGEDQLFGVADETAALLADLDDVLQVEAFFTGRALHGPVQVAKRRLVGQLRELASMAGGRMRVVHRDPNRSSEERVEAARLGIQPVPIQATSGTGEVSQEVYLGLVLRYRGREKTLPFVLPQSLEYSFATELSRLLREEPITVGVLGVDASRPMADGQLPPAPGLSGVRTLLARDHEVVDVRGTSDGLAVPERVDVLLVARPIGLHPRAVFAVDQFVQRGGRLLVLVDHVLTSSGPEPVPVSTGVEGLLAAWGAPVARGHVWDVEGANSLRLPSGAALAYPYWIRVAPGGLASDVPATSRLPGADLFWAHEVEAVAPPAGVVRTDLAWSSATAWRAPEVATLSARPEDLNAQAAELLAAAEPRRIPLAAALSGDLPTAFEQGAPAPRDPVDEARWLAELRAALGRGEDPPPYPPSEIVPDEPVERGDAPGTVCVVGDADWVQDGETWTERNRMLLASLVDWLGQPEGYRGLRARLPRERRIVDFLAEERAREGLSTLGGELSLDRAEGVSRAETAAQERAARRRWLRMALATGGSLLLAGGLFLATRLALLATTARPRAGGSA